MRCRYYFALESKGVFFTLLCLTALRLFERAFFCTLREIDYSYKHTIDIAGESRKGEHYEGEQLHE